MATDKYTLDSTENKDFLQQIADDLFRFGAQFAAPDGTAYYLGTDGTPLAGKDRATYETARMAHSYALGAMLGREDSAQLAADALRGLRALEDKENGGWWEGLDANGAPLDGKLAYTHAFVVLAASSGLLAGIEGSRKLLDDALEAFQTRFWDSETGLVRDRWDTDFASLDTYRGLNANMHSVEALLAAADALGDESLRDQAGLIIRWTADIASRNDYRIPEHYTEDWQPVFDYNDDRRDDPFRPYGATPGHGFEWSRLILQWALSLQGDDAQDAARYIDVSENLFRRAVMDGWNADGAPGIVYTTDWNGAPVVADRMHWTLAEAIGAAAALYRATKNPEYAQWYATFLKYLDETVLDHEHGSWFHQMDANGSVLDTVWPGKPDIYHALQASLIPYLAPDRAIAAAVAASC